MRVAPDVPPGVTITAVAYVNSSQTQPWTIDPVEITVTYPQLALSKAVTPAAEVYPLDLVTYTLRYTNTGNAPADRGWHR